MVANIHECFIDSVIRGICITLLQLRSKESVCYKSDVAQFATLVEWSNELSAHLAVQHLDVTLPNVLTAH